jgi:hypothetical protein
MNHLINHTIFGMNIDHYRTAALKQY